MTVVFLIFLGVGTQIEKDIRDVDLSIAKQERSIDCLETLLDKCKPCPVHKCSEIPHAAPCPIPPSPKPTDPVAPLPEPPTVKKDWPLWAKIVVGAGVVLAAGAAGFGIGRATTK